MASGPQQSFPLVQTADRNINQLQQNISQAMTPILKNPIANGGVILTSVSLSVGSNVIAHGLGRVAQGWVLCDLNASAKIYRSAAFSDTTLTLTSDVAATINVCVF